MRQNRALSAQIKVTNAQAQAAKQEAQQQLTQAQTMQTQVQAKEAQLDTVIQRQVAAETRHTKREVTERYQKKTLKTQALLFLPTVYAVVLTVIELFKVPSLLSDSQQFFRQLGWLITQPAGWLSQWLRPAWVRGLAGGLLGLVMIGLLLAALGIVAYGVSRVNWHFLDTVMLLGILIGIMLFGETIKALWPVNLVWLLVLGMASYVGIRAVMTK
ncbi:DUF6040 family protein [Secundilactobacillus kimchicus]|uniref:DUF6040 family protein n=1 Tax=Secundilactobacillus kimchicus TaxID=528209 RepID=UPI0007054AB7|nr:DUF6040 family protein [Secundilactobacillus kimchicus]